MRIDVFRTIAVCLLLGLSGSAFGHGLIQDPPSRNWFCGALTKPDHVLNGTAQFPVCGDAFNAPGIEFSWGYSFMSVLTHTTGRAGIGPRENVCGFNSETWNGVPTVWDQPINWPTNAMTAGPHTFTWSISWGPHFSDTEDFKYWITKPTFQYQVGRPLSFDDFEELPFCDLRYDDTNPNGNPNIIPNVAAATFETRCTVPQRTGRHVIYAEWGRNFFTFERFHGCIDVVFQGGSGPTVDAEIALTPNVTEFQGAGTITLDGRGSVGSNLSYQWSIDSENPSLYTLTNANQSVATLTLANPQAAGNLTILLTVSSGSAADSATRTLIHRPTGGGTWFDLGPLTPDPITMVVGDRVQVRTISSAGQDAFWPTNPLVITADTAAPAAWPLALAQAVNAQNGAVRIGILNAQNQVVPAQNATTNRVYAMTSANITSAFLQRAVGNVPVAPTGVTATAGNGQVTINWSAVTGATGYNVKRSTTSGGPYANVGAGVTGTTFTDTTAANGTTYFYVVTALNASGESPISLQASATPGGGGTGDGGVTITPAVATSNPWFNEQQIRISNTSPITALSITVIVQRTTGVNFSGQYNTVGSQIQQSNSSTASAITYQFSLASGQSLSPGTSRSFAAQMTGNGTAHPTSGDTYTVTYTSGGVTRTQTGTF